MRRGILLLIVLLFSQFTHAGYCIGYTNIQRIEVVPDKASCDSFAQFFQAGTALYLNDDQELQEYLLQQDAFDLSSLSPAKFAQAMGAGIVIGGVPMLAILAAGALLGFIRKS